MTPAAHAAPQGQELRSVFTSSLAEILNQLNLSLVVSTYQAGKVILVRHDGGTAATGGQAGTVNTHFRTFPKPMGLAAKGGRLAIGSQKSVWELHSMPALARKLAPAGKHDACYLPRRIHITGDIDIHEMAYAGDNELWLVNTRFGCLCTLDAQHSFHPRWRPPFVSAYAPEDRCHLNGLAMVEGRPRYVTALGATDTAGGWRANKASGGILIDVESDEILLRGLSMPHSPRWYNGRLWLLESGQGGLAWVDQETRRWHTVCRLPGFTRGLDFYGPLAFIGLSQVRETATFSGIPLVERLSERTCGVWVVNIQTGETLAFLRFEQGVEEIFAVQVLPDTRFPEILEWDDPHVDHAYVLPDAALAETPQAEPIHKR
ncbi:MAG TPA: TIGR03032 family protein [Roseiflexaceae bacterium]|nr:TIGR03032 family protein [Roseiflexaceae bacterium]